VMAVVGQMKHHRNERRKNKMKTILGKMKIVAVALSCVILGVLFYVSGNGEVQAETTATLNTTDTETEYVYAEFSGDELLAQVSQCMTDNAVPVVSGTEGYLFAGWFSDKTFAKKSAVRTFDESISTYYAKYVPEDVLSIRAQVSTVAGTDDNSNATRNIRFVSSVDSLAYSKVGFKLEFGDTTKYNNSTTVFQRIESSTTGDEFTFSPKIIDTDSEYFMTATWTDVLETDTTGFYVRAYIKTLDGVVIYGPSRYVTVTDGLSNNQVIVPMEGTVADSATVTYNDGTEIRTASAVEVINNANKDTDDTYTHVRITLAGTKSELDSVTTFAVADTTLSAKYRYPYTKYTGTGTDDMTWYNQYDKNAEKEFVIATSADLYGFANVVNGTGITADKFAGKTVYMVADIKANGTDSTYNWPGIGLVSGGAGFAGEFDGQMNTISGIKQTRTADGGGLFADIQESAVIKNFKLIDSSFDAGSKLYCGSIVGHLRGGIIENIYSNATITNGGTYTGGLIGCARHNLANFSMNNCWFDGSVTNNEKFLGGLIGSIGNASGTSTYTQSIKNCLNTGDILIPTTSTNTRYVGGLFGYSYSRDDKMTISNCLNTSEIQPQNTNYGGGTGSRAAQFNMIGYTELANDKLTSEFSSVYTTSQSLTSVNGATTNPTGVYAVTDTNTIVGTKAMEVMPAFYTSVSENGINKVYWAVTDETPILGDFIEFAKDGVDAVAFDTTWYDGSKNYTLYDASDLYGFAKLSKDKSEDFYEETIKLGTDITIPNDGEALNWEDNAPTFSWQSICPTTGFQGTFDGQGHEIGGIYLSNTASGSNGLFGITGTNATVQNFSLKDSYFYSSKAIIGSIVGTAKGTFDSIYSSAIVKTSDIQIGGIIGTVNGTFTMDNCWFAGELESSGTHHIGGLVGHIQNAGGTQTITNCLNTGEIVSTNITANYVGCLIGYCQPGISISNCLNTKELQYNTSTSKTAYGLIAGSFSAPSSTVISSVYTIDQEGVKYSNTVPSNSYIVSATSIMGGQASTTLSRLFASKTDDGDDYWLVTSGTPVLATFAEYAEETVVVVADTSWYNDDANEFTIRTADELYGLAKLCNDYTDTFEGKTIKLGADICINKGTATEWEDGTHLPINIWTPIGITPGTAFAGSFDGQGHTISGIYLKSDSEYLGMFGILNTAGKATIKNLRLTNSYLERTSSSGLASGVHGLGSIAGQGSGRLDNVYSNAILVNGSTNTGGLVGSVVQSNVTLDVINCWFTGSVTGGVQDTTAENDWVGGIVGYATSDVTINMTNCLVAADISSKLAQGSSYVGGLSGRVGAGQIQSCMVVGTINYEQSGYACSIVGTTVNSGLSIQECYNATNTSQDWSNVAPTIIDVTRFTDCGAGNYNLEKANTTYEDYCTYLATLENKGFTKYAMNVLDSVENNTASGVWNATYTKEEMVMTVIYVAKTNKTYIAVGKDLPLSEHLLYQAKYIEGNKEGAQTTLHMPELHTYGDSFIIQLKNGHFILADGGMSQDTQYLLDYLEELVPEGEKPVIEAWFISHGHNDHIGILCAFDKTPEYTQRICVEGVYFSEPFCYDSTKWDVIESGLRGALNCRTSSGAVTPIYRPQTGQRYYFNDITIDILYTHEQLSVDIYKNDFNESSTWLLYTIEGQTFLHAGDTGEQSISVVKNSYNQAYLDFDVMATFHHGQNVYNSYVDYFKYKTVLYTTFVTDSQTANLNTDANNRMKQNALENDGEYTSWGEGTKILTFPYVVGASQTLPLRTWTYHPDRETPTQYKLNE